MEWECAERGLLLVDSGLVQEHDASVDAGSEKVYVLVLVVLDNRQVEVQNRLRVSCGLDYLFKDSFHVIFQFFHISFLGRDLALDRRRSFDIDLNVGSWRILLRPKFSFSGPLQMRDNLHLVHELILNNQVRVHHIVHHVERAQLCWVRFRPRSLFFVSLFLADEIYRDLELLEFIGLALFVKLDFSHFCN